MDTAAVLPLQAPKDVSVEEIQAELRQIWESKGESVAARAATFNLIVFESQADRPQAFSSTVDAIASQNPCRVIDLQAMPSGTGEILQAQVAAYCPIRQERSSLVCCEYITLQASPESFERACSTISSLLIGDLPTYLWWQGDLDLDSRLFQLMVGLSHRIIADSSTFVNPEEDLQEMHLLASRDNYVGDLNWRRLNSWQELTAQAFDPPERRTFLSSVDLVTIDYQADNPCQAWLYLGWFASRLGWEPSSRKRHQEHDYLIDRIAFRSPSDLAIQVELASVPTITTTPGELVGLRLNSTDPAADACTVLCSETTGCMRMEEKGGAQRCRIQQVSPIEQQTAETLLSQQLQRVGKDLLYEESLAMVEAILTAPQTD
ncbi:glucose-6-phosphate dehydrogenase assembly protein OpcA [Synechococcus sp. PCC 7336]|uniref:glucose-6-phosphate dehydrogenase assembly protein OpcA n=1 Tax=Synechococcus sp. PCC 7336 TaxID=195250 RepID=UPI00034B6331|nr:glucose-6-phosphate dehydrogenase assembly protein OpcA [Synechococcus sp. PCC 7336]